MCFGFIITLTGCGGGGDTGDATQSLSGTMATGAPSTGFVYVVDANGASANTQITSDAKGKFSVAVTGMQAPFMLAGDIDDGAGVAGTYDLFSYAESANMTANITTLTTLSLAVANGNDNLSLVYNNWDKTQLSTSKIKAGKNTVTVNFKPVRARTTWRVGEKLVNRPEGLILS